jgi:hypothetical protein
MKALAIIALAVALEAGFLLSALLPAAPSGSSATAVARPLAPAPAKVPATAASGCPGGGPRC